GTPRHAHKRGLYTEGKGFKGNVDGCLPQYSFHYNGTGNMLFVFEAPIDMLSYITLHPQSWQSHSYVALCGVGSQAMHWMLAQNPQITEVALCLDNDEAGHKATARIREQLTEGSYPVERLLPSGKDWNDDLVMQQQGQSAPAMQMT
ncbi:MAG: toprim domain-containing protein, partial [Oscillospiraceae bacterium]